MLRILHFSRRGLQRSQFLVLTKRRAAYGDKNVLVCNFFTATWYRAVDKIDFIQLEFVNIVVPVGDSHLITTENQPTNRTSASRKRKGTTSTKIRIADLKDTGKQNFHRRTFVYYMVSSVSDHCPFGTTRSVPQENFPLNPLQTKLVRSRWLDIGPILFSFLRTSTLSRSSENKTKNEANVQPCLPQTWSLARISDTEPHSRLTFTISPPCCRIRME